MAIVLSSMKSLTMAMRASSDIMLTLVLMTLLQYSEAWSTIDHHAIDRTSFPDGFIFGASSSAYQYEGAAREGGKGPSIWDTFTHKYPRRIARNGNGDVAIDFYHQYKEDVKIMKEMGIDAFRFSISWPRILPSGKLSGGVNKQGIDFYNSLINELLVKGVEPFVTIFHWDTPQALEDAYGGFLSNQIVDDFRDFAQVCFEEFGDRVKNWVTINEPYTYSAKGYDDGECAPGRCSAWVSSACQAGNSATEPYIVAHNLLLSHAAAVNLYKQMYQATQGGKIGITVTTLWMVPYSNTTADHDAASRALDFMLGWFMDPLTFGDYPLSMRTLVGERLPNFTSEQSEMVKGSFDFIGMNYYTAYYAVNVPSPNLVNISYSTDSLASLTGVRDGLPIGPQAGSSWLYVYPRGLRDLLVYTTQKYNNPIIYITENGVDEYNNVSLTVSEALEDPMRIKFFRSHLMFLHRAIREGVRVKGYFVWTLLDDFEWYAGYTVRFGFHFVDYANNLKRYPKSSAIWFTNFLKDKSDYSDS